MEERKKKQKTNAPWEAPKSREIAATQAKTARRERRRGKRRGKTSLGW